MPSKKNLAPGILDAALEGLELYKKRIEEQIAEVRSLLSQRRSGWAAVASVTEMPANKRKRSAVSETSRKRIAKAQKKRWAAYRAKGGAANHGGGGGH
jgi:hypothetical protein